MTTFNVGMKPHCKKYTCSLNCVLTLKLHGSMEPDLHCPTLTEEPLSRQWAEPGIKSRSHQNCLAVDDTTCLLCSRNRSDLQTMHWISPFQSAIVLGPEKGCVVNEPLRPGEQKARGGRRSDALVASRRSAARAGHCTEQRRTPT